MKTLSKKYFFIFIIIFLSFDKTFSQTNNIKENEKIINQKIYQSEKESNFNKGNKSILTDILPEKLQFGYNNGLISSKDNSLIFSGSLHGWKTLFGKNTPENEQSYITHKFNRNFTIGSQIFFKNDNQIKGLNLNLKYAILNNRDPENANYFIKDIMKMLSIVSEAYQKKANDTNPISKSDTEKLKNSLNKFTNTQNLNDLDPELLKLVDANKFYSLKSNAIEAIEVLNIKKPTLWTIALNSNYANNKWSEITLQSEFIKGLGGIEREREDYPWDLYGGVFFKNLQDTTNLEKSINRTVLTGKFGVNKVLALTKSDIKSSALEVLLNVEYNYIPRGRYSNEEEKTFMLASTISIRLAQNVYFPVEIKYDPKNGNFFGFLKIKWDMLRFNQ